MIFDVHRLDILVLNAGVALTKKYMTEDGFELHMASNHFGHFLLTNLLLPLLRRTAARNETNAGANGSAEPTNVDPVRVVAVSSIAHFYANLDLDNLNSEKYYDVRTTVLCYISMNFKCDHVI